MQRFYKLLKIEASFHSMNIEQLLNFLENDKKLTNEHIEMVAFVLKEQGELSEESQAKIDFFQIDLSEKIRVEIEYKDGVSIKIPENIPHEFISVFNEEENCPYCQVFEPNMEEICNIFHYTPTEFFNLNSSSKSRV